MRNKYNQHHFGPNGQNFGVEVLHEEGLPFLNGDTENFLRYSDTLLSEGPSLATSTVRVSQLPPSNPLSNISQIVEEINWENPDDGYDLDEEHEPDGMTRKQIVQKDDVPSDILLELHSVCNAISFRQEFNGRYWKNDTLHVDFCSDAAFEEFERKKAA